MAFISFIKTCGAIYFSIKNLKRDDEIDLPKATDNTSMQLDLPEDVEAADEEVETEDVDSPLISVNKRLEMTKVTKTNFPRTFFKYCNYEWCIKEKGLKSKLDFDILKFPTIVACVKVYHPFMSLRNQPIKIKLLQEIHILGDQTLSQLKDKIVCSLDYIGDKDLSNEWFLKDVGYNVTAKVSSLLINLFKFAN